LLKWGFKIQTTEYIIKNIPIEIREMQITGKGLPIKDGDPFHKQFKIALANWLNNELEFGNVLHGIDFHCNVAIFKYKSFEIEAI